MKSKGIYGSNIERHQLYGTWVNMKCRCYVKASNRYENYGGRGIKVCDRWLEPNGQGFWNFVADMGERPTNPDWWTGIKSYYSLERIDNNGNYEPSNCRWATAHEQSANKQKKSDVTNLFWSKSGGHWEARIQVAGTIYRKRVKNKDAARMFLEDIRGKYGI